MFWGNAAISHKLGIVRVWQRNQFVSSVGTIASKALNAIKHS